MLVIKFLFEFNMTLPLADRQAHTYLYIYFITKITNKWYNLQ
jgi:hypothetical protein